MKQLVYDAATDTTTIKDAEYMNPSAIETVAVPTIEERVGNVETDVDEIVTVLGTIEGVSV